MDSVRKSRSIPTRNLKIRVAVDFPCYSMCFELKTLYPDSKAVLSVRASDAQEVDVM